MPILEQPADKVATDEAAGSGDKYRFIHGVLHKERVRDAGWFSRTEKSRQNTTFAPQNQSGTRLSLPHRKPLSATSDPKANNRRQHVYGVANEVNLASRDIKPVDGKLNHPGAVFGERDEKFDIEGEALLVKTILDGFIALVAHEFETTLGIVDRDAGCQTYERGKETPSKMAEPRSLDRATEDLAARTK
jgi:hypothetical protein